MAISQEKEKSSRGVKRRAELLAAIKCKIMADQLES